MTSRNHTVEDFSLTPAGNQRKILGRSIKVEKGEKQGVLTAILYMSPSTESGINMCPWSTAGCAIACLGHSSGKLAMDHAKQSRIAKTMWFVHYREHFLAQLDKEIAAHARKAARQGKKAAIRLSGSTDNLWERLVNMAAHPTVNFYDYTKAPLGRRSDLPENYSLTFSYSEDPGSHAAALQYLAAGHNVAIVVRNKRQAAGLVDNGFCGFPAIDGDATDLRFEDPPGHWVALYAKGAARKDTSGFVQDLAA